MTNLKSVSRDLRFAAGLLRRRPFQCLLQVTNRCNMKCSFCDFWPNGAPRSQELSIADFQRLSEQLTAIGCFVVSIEGGEPFVRPDLIDIVQAFGDRHIPLLYTNGWFVNDENASALFAAGLMQVGVSIDFPDADRHDKKRGLAGGFEKAWQAVMRLRDAAPHGGKQVHVMTVLMRENQRDLESLLEMSAKHQVGHCVTLLSTKGFRRGAIDQLPSESIGTELQALWRRYPHLRAFRDYLEGIDPFLSGATLPTCRAGNQSFNIDHVGNVSPCIEKIDHVIGNVRQEPLPEILKRMTQLEEVAGCQSCWTLCRGFNQALGSGGSLQSWQDLTRRMRSS